MHSRKQRQAVKLFPAERLPRAVERAGTRRIEHEIAKESRRVRGYCCFHTALIFRNAGNQGRPADAAAIQLRDPASGEKSRVRLRNLPIQQRA